MRFRTQGLMNWLKPQCPLISKAIPLSPEPSNPPTPTAQDSPRYPKLKPLHPTIQPRNHETSGSAAATLPNGTPGAHALFAFVSDGLRCVVITLFRVASCRCSIEIPETLSLVSSYRCAMLAAIRFDFQRLVCPGSI